MKTTRRNFIKGVAGASAAAAVGGYVSACSDAAAERNFAAVTGVEWTAAELAAQGIDKDKIPRLIKNGLIERVRRNYYRRVSS